MKKIRNIVAAVVLTALSASCFSDELNAQGQVNIDSIAVGNTTYTNVVVTIGSIVSVGGSCTLPNVLTNGACVTPTTPAAANYSGTWVANYGGYSITAAITQTGNNLSIALSSPILAPGQIFAGALNGNTVSVAKNDYASSATATLTILNSTTLSAVQNSCSAKPGYQCVVPISVPIIFTKQ